MTAPVPASLRPSRTRSVLVGRRVRVGVAAVSAVLLTAGCAAGKIAATSQELPTLDGANTKVGSLRLEGIAFSAPTSGSSYGPGSTVPLQIVISNQSQHNDALTGVSSPAFAGWNIARTANAASGTGSTSPASIPAGGALTLSLQNVGADSSTSPRSLLLLGLKKKGGLYAGNSVPVTFTFTTAGSTTVDVPVQLTTNVPRQHVPSPAPGDD